MRQISSAKADTVSDGRQLWKQMHVSFMAFEVSILAGTLSYGYCLYCQISMIYAYVRDEIMYFGSTAFRHTIDTPQEKIRGASAMD
jgi:hypothetical protein